MRRVLSALLLLLAAAPLAALDVPPTPTHWFTDTAGVVDSAAASQLDQKLAAFEQRSGAQFIIYIFPSLENEALEDFTIRCVEKWKVGNKKYDNGIVLFLFARDRKARIEVGYGLESVVTDAFSSRVIRNDLAPHLQKNDWPGGLNAAADDLMSRISSGQPAVAPVTQSGRGTTQIAGRNVGCADVAGLVILLLVFLFIILPMMRRGGCGGCFWPMFFLGGGGGGGGFTFGGGGGGWSGGGGGFSGGGGSFGGGGASGGW